MRQVRCCFGLTGSITTLSLTEVSYGYYIPIKLKQYSMKRISIFLLLTAIVFASCDDDDHEMKISNCDQHVIVNSETYRDAPDDPLSINSLSIDEDCLTINFSSSGCDGNSWQLELIDADVILESNPPQRNLRLSLKNEELCLAQITMEVSFDISALRVDDNQVFLNITNSDDRILYEY